MPQEHITDLIMFAIYYNMEILVVLWFSKNGYMLSLCVWEIVYVKKVGLYDGLLDTFNI